MKMSVPLRATCFARRASFCRGVTAAAAALILASAAFAQSVTIRYVDFDPVDATANIRAAIEASRSDPGASKIILTDQATPWYTSDTIVLDRPNQQIWFANGAKVMAKEGGHLDYNDCMFLITADNVKLNGYANGVDASAGITTIEMRKADYQQPPYQGRPSDGKNEFRHVISVRGASNTILQGLNLVRSGGDGIAINKSLSGSIPPYNTTIVDVVCDDNHRQGMSVFCADILNVTNSTFKNTVGTAPQSGVDIEPTAASDILKGIKFVNCQFSGNAGNNVEINPHALAGTNLQPIDIRLESCLIEDGAKNGLAFYGLDPTNGPTGTVVVKNTTIRNSTLSGLIFSGWGADRVSVTMANVDLIECNPSGSKPPILFTQNDPAVPHGDVTFQSGCHIHESFTRTNAMVYAGTYVRNAGLKDITGTIDVHRPASSTGPLLSLGSNTVNCTLTVTLAP